MANFLTSADTFSNALKVARAFSQSTLVPEHMRHGKDGGMENCLVALHIANQMGEDPLQVMQSMYIVKGRPGWMTNFLVSRANRCGKFVDGIDWEIEGEGDSLKVTAFAQLRRPDGSEGRVVRVPIDYKSAVENGWTTRYDKETRKQVQKETWATEPMRQQMLRWRTAGWLINLYAPDVRFGMPTVEELEDAASNEMKDVTPPPAPRMDDFKPSGARVSPRAEDEERHSDREFVDIPASSSPAMPEGEEGGAPPARPPSSPPPRTDEFWSQETYVVPGKTPKVRLYNLKHLLPEAREQAEVNGIEEDNRGFIETLPRGDREEIEDLIQRLRTELPITVSAQ